MRRGRAFQFLNEKRTDSYYLLLSVGKMTDVVLRVHQLIEGGQQGVGI